jgi:hypothetical protein
LSHARVYLNQLKDESFNKVPEKMQLGLVASFANHLLNYQAEEGLNGPVDVVGLVEDFNKSNKSGFALTINVSYTATSAYSYSIYKGDKLVAKDKIKKTQTSEE